jgi:hypothetical protein
MRQFGIDTTKRCDETIDHIIVYVKLTEAIIEGMISEYIIFRPPNIRPGTYAIDLQQQSLRFFSCPFDKWRFNLSYATWYD